MSLTVKLGTSPITLSRVPKCRKKEVCKARVLFAYLAVEEIGYTAADIARYLRITESSVFNGVKRGKILFGENSKTNELQR